MSHVDDLYMQRIRGLDYQIEKLREQRLLLINTLIEADEQLGVDGVTWPSISTTLHQFGYRQIKGGKWLPLDICVCTIPETQHWELGEEKMALIERIESVYFYDRNSVTHLCEITPSYELHLLETRAIWKDGVEVSDRLSDEIDQDIRGEITSDDWITYVHCHEVDPLEKLPKEAFRFFHSGNPEVPMEEDEDEETFHDRVMQAVREELQGNCVL